MRTYLILIPLFSLLIGCQHLAEEPSAGSESVTRPEGIDPAPDPWATTANATYKAGEEIFVTIGTPEGVISVRTCCSNTPAYYVDRLEAGKWIEQMRHEIDCMRMCAQYGVSVSSPQPLHVALDPGISESGVYRFRFLYADEITSDKELVSNSFDVE